MLIIVPGQEASSKYIFIFFNMTVCWVFTLESPHGGDSDEYTQYAIFNINKENHPKLS